MSNNENNNKNPQIFEINDIIGEKCPLDLDILNIPFNNFEKAKTSSKIMGNIKAYGANTYQGLVRNYNEDRVSIIINMTKPENYKKKVWPKISFFGIYDGHGGSKCADFLRDFLHKIIFSNENFPENIEKCLKNSFLRAENEFLYKIASDKSTGNVLDRSGSCGIILIIVDTKIYIANVGDSRAIMSLNNGKEYKIITKDHKPSNEEEKKRIIQGGGEVYQTQTPINNMISTENEANNDINLNNQILIGPFRVLPGRLSVSRTIGDIEAKLIQYGGNPQVIIPLPDVYVFDLKKNDIDFIVLGCDGIFDQLSNKEILDSGWNILSTEDDLNIKCGNFVDFILKASMARKSFDNITCVVIALKEKFILDKQKIVNDKKFISENLNLNLEENITKNRTLNNNNKNNEKKKKNKNFFTKKKIIQEGKKTNNNINNIKNIRKVLNKSEVNPSSLFNNEKNKIEYDKIHLKRTFIKQIPKFNLTNSLTNLNFELTNSPIEKIRHSINILKINKISNRIQSSNHLNRKKKEKNGIKIKNKNSEINLNSNYSLNKNKKRFITMSNLYGINNITNITNIMNITNMNNININSSNIRQKFIKNKIKKKLSDIKLNKNRNELKIKLQNNSGINSFRNYIYKNEIRSSSTNRNLVTNSSRRQTSSHNKILTNLIYNFENDKKKQKIKKYFSKIDTGLLKRRLTEKKINHKFSKNPEKNKKLNLNINYINSTNNYNTKKTKEGIKYLNSVGNNKINSNTNSININTIENNRSKYNRFHKIIHPKNKIKKQK